MKMKKILISVFLAVLSTVYLAGQEKWRIEDFEDRAAKEQWSPYGDGVFWHGCYRSLTYSSQDDINVDSVYIVKDHETRKEAKEDFTELLFFYRQAALEEWKIKRNKYLIYLEDYGVYIERKGKRVIVEFAQYTGEE